MTDAEVADKINGLYMAMLRLESRIQDLEIKLRKLDEKECNRFLGSRPYLAWKQPKEETKEEDDLGPGYPYI